MRKAILAAGKRMPFLNLMIKAKVASKSYVQVKPFAFLGRWQEFMGEYRKYKQQDANSRFKTDPQNLFPCLLDKTETTPIEPIYFYQMSWFGRKVFEGKPKRHVDVGSHVPSLGIVSQFVPITFVDIRPIEVTLPGLDFIEGTILNLPFESNSVESISSICVIEHIGLGRYGDPIDAFGSEKSVEEILRVTQPGGDIYITVPIDRDNIIYFNAHRAFTPDYVKELFQGCEVKEELYLYEYDLGPVYKPEAGFGTGFFHFRKQA